MQEGLRVLPALPPEKTPVELPVDGRRPLVGLSIEEMTDWLAELGEPRFRARQLFHWVYARGASRFADMTNLPTTLRDRLAEVAAPVALAEDVRQGAVRTRTTKYLFTLLADGQKVESVLMRHDYGWSACITTQVGCRMGCTFCASTFGGLVRNLTAGEIVEQLITMQRDVPEGERIGHVVLMGSGEPLENYDNVVRAIRLMHEPEGLNIGYRHVTVSTSGLVPAMRRLATEGLPVTLALSLHAPNDDLRTRLMPINRSWPVADVIAAARDYAQATGRRVTIEYILIAGVNDEPEHAAELAGLLDGLLAAVNLIPMNPVAERPDYRVPSPARVRAFREALESRGISATIRREMGGEIDAACGQLRNRSLSRHGSRP